MKWNPWFLACSVGIITSTIGCGGKDQSANSTAASSTAPGGASPAVDAASAPPPATNAVAAAATNAAKPSFNEGTGDAPATSNPDQGAPAKPSRPTFGAAGTTSSAPSQEESKPATPSRPSFGAAGGSAAPAAPTTPSAPARPSFGSAGAPGAPPANPSNNSPSAPNTSSAGTTKVENPFEDPSHMLPPSIELSLRDRAVNAFKSGNVPRAYGLYQAHLLSSPREDLESALQSVRWDKKRIVPRLGYRFAVGLIVNNTSKQESLKPIGTDLEGLRGSGGGAAGGGGGRPGFGAGGFGGGGGAAGGSSANLPVLPAKELSDAAGKYASKFVEAFDKAHGDGKWSEAFREYEFGSSITTPTSVGGFAAGFSGAGFGAPGTGAPGLGAPGAGAPPGYGGGQGGPPAGYAGGPGAGGPPGYGGGQGGPPAGYTGGSSGAPPGYGGGQGGPPAGYTGGSSGAPPGYGGAQGGPPAGYTGGSSGAPPGYGGAGGAAGKPPAGGQPPAGQNNGGSAQDRVDYVAPQDDADSLLGGAGSSFGTNSNTTSNAPGQSGRPGFGAPGAPGFGAPAAPPAMDPALAKDLQLPSGTIPLASGLNFIGKGSSVGELSKRALDQHYDILIVFEVDVSFVPVNQTIKNDCRIRAIDLHADKDSKEKVIVSAQLNNRDVATDKDSDGRIEKAVENFLKKMHEAYPLDDLPSFKAESITGKRLKDLVNNKVRSKLDLLCEVELYAYRGLIDNTLKLAAFDRIAGSDGKELANSEPEDRIPILEKMISRQFD